MKPAICLLTLSLVVAACQPGDKPTVSTPPTSKPSTTSKPSPTTGAKEIPANAKVFFIEPKHGATLKSPVKFKFGVEGMDLVAAGERLGDMSAGHHHLLINQGAFTKGQVIPMDETHLHYGKAQSEASVELKPGKYKLTMQFADALHQSYGSQLAATIEITVEE